MTGDDGIARLRFQGLADALHDRHERLVELVAARFEHPFAADAHENALRVLVDRDEALLDLRLQEFRELLRLLDDDRHGYWGRKARDLHAIAWRKTRKIADRVGRITEGIGEPHKHQQEHGSRYHGDDPGWD